MISSIKIGGLVYTVSEVEGLTDVIDGRVIRLDGQVQFSDLTIKVEQDIAQPVKAAVLWHEIVHAALHYAGHDDHKEEQIEALGYALAQVIKENPALVAYTQKAELTEDGS